MQYHIFSPYRVCPLGAHVDHQHGLVTGFAIDKGVDLWFDIRNDAHVHLESKTFEGIVAFELDSPTQVRERHWGDYARGAKFALKKRFELKRGITGVRVRCPLAVCRPVQPCSLPMSWHLPRPTKSPSSLSKW